MSYVRYLSPPRSTGYARWHRWARRPLAKALDRARPFDLVHAHYAHLAGAAALPWTEANQVPLVVSVHGGDVIVPALARTSAATLRGAKVVMCNSRGSERLAAAIAGSDENMRVVHLGSDVPPESELPAKHPRPTVATLANVDPRKRHEDVLRALPDGVHWTVIGDGPALPQLKALTRELGLADRVTFTGKLAPAEALQELARAHVMALPSVDEAFGVAYVEALAHGVPAIGCEGESGPEEIAALSGGAMLLVPRRDPRALAAAIERALADQALPRRARRRRGALHVEGMRRGDRGRVRGGAGEMKPVALVTGEVSPYREEPFRMLDEAEGVEVIAWGETGQMEAARRVGSGRYRAVIAGLGGRIALPGSYLAARRARIPFVLWASMWSHPRTPAHALSWLPTRELYRRADAVVTYGRHVSAYVESKRGARGNVFEAPQAVSAGQFGAPVAPAALGDGFVLLFVGRLEREKGVEVLLEAWRRAGLTDRATLVFAGSGPLHVEGPGIHVLGTVPRGDLPALYARADALVLPSIRTATFLEPWGLVVNEAMHQGTPVIASDAVGAVAGGLVRDGRNGLVAPAGDAQALAARIEALEANPELRAQLGAAAKEDVATFSEEAWVRGMRDALHAVGAGRVSR